MCTVLGLTEKGIRLIGCGFVSRIFGLQKYDIFNISQPIDVDFSRSLQKTRNVTLLFMVDQHNRAPEQSGAFVLFEGKNEIKVEAKGCFFGKKCIFVVV